MNKSLIVCDRLMFGALLGMIIFIPSGRALIETCQLTMFMAWGAKRLLIYQGRQRLGGGQENSFPSSGMGWPLIAIGLLIILTVPFSQYPILSLKKFFSRFLQQIFIMYCVAEIVRNRQRLYIVLGVILLVVFAVCLDALSQYVWVHSSLIFGRIEGPMHHPNDLGTLLATVLPIVFILMITAREWIPSLWGNSGPPGDKKTWLSGVFAFMFMVLVCTLGLTSSRGAWVAFFVSMVTLVFCVKRQWIKILMAVLLILFFWVFGMYCLNTRSDLYNLPANHGPILKPSWNNPWGLPEQYSAYKLFSVSTGRGLYWDTAIGVIKKYPWFGCGYSAYVQTLNNLKVGHAEYPHDSVLHITAELGFVGLILYGWLFIALCLKIKNVLQVVSRDRDLFLLGVGVSCGILAWMIHSLVDTPWSSLQLSIVLWLLIGILLSLGLVLPVRR